MQSIESLYQKYKDQDVVVLGIDIRESEAVVRKFAREDNDYNWIFLLDSTGAVARDYQASSIPKNFFIDATGVIRATRLGAISMSRMEELLAEAMGEQQ
jgi:peroxiredoxin